MELTALKTKASEAFAKGKFGKAGELYADYCAQAPKDVQSRVRMGDAWAKAGQPQRAIAAYTSAAEAFAKDGFLPRAIAASKLILELDPVHQGVQQMLADLYAQKGVPPPRAARPASQPEPSLPAAPSPEPAVAVEPAGTSEPEVEAELPGDEILLEEPAEASSPVTSAPSVPPTPAAPELPRAPVSAADTLEAALAAVEEPSNPPASERGDLEASLRSLAQPPSHAAPVPRAEPPRTPAPSSVASAFTELELSGDSLLQALELAAGAPHAAAHVHASPAMENLPADPGALPKIPLFSDLPPDAFIELFERCPLRRFSRDELVLEQGSRGDAFYVICEGKVQIERREGEHVKVLAQLGEGAFFGEMALLSGAPRTASARSVSEDTHLLEISASVLEPLARRHPSVAQALRKFCRQRLLSNVMDSSELFRPFSRHDRRELIERFRAKEVQAGEGIVREGERSDGLYVVLSGEVRVHRGETVVAQLREGQLFGEISLLTKQPAKASVTSSRRTSLLRLPREDFDALVLSHPQVLMLVSELAESRTRELEHRLAAAPVEDDEPLVMV